MQVSCDKKLLETAVLKAKDATEKKAALPILSNFLILAEGSELIIKATDVENFLTLKIPANVIREGKVCVNSAKLAEILKNVKCSEIYLSNEGNYLVVQCGRGKFKIAGVDVEEYPEFPQLEEGNKYSVDGQVLISAIERTEYAIPKDADNPALKGLYIKGNGSECHFVGTDGHRLALYKPAENFEGELLIPKKSLKVLKKLLSKLETVDIGRYENLAIFEGENWSLAIRMLEGEFPDYESIIPTDTLYKIKVNTEDFIAVLKRVSALIEGKVKPVRLRISKNKMVVEAEDPDFGNAQDEIDIVMEKGEDELVIEFNAKYLIEALDNYDSEEVLLLMDNAETPAVIKAVEEDKEPYICLIMPLSF